MSDGDPNGKNSADTDFESAEVEFASDMDGDGGWQFYMHVIFPDLPIEATRAFSFEGGDVCITFKLGPREPFSKFMMVDEAFNSLISMMRANAT